MSVSGNPHQNWITSGLKENTTGFIASDGLCAKNKINTKNISWADLFFCSFLNGFRIKVKIADTDSSLYYMLNSQTLKGEAIGFENNTTKYYSISFEEFEEESG